MDFYHLLNETKDCFERYIAVSVMEAIHSTDSYKEFCVTKFASFPILFETHLGEVLNHICFITQKSSTCKIWRKKKESLDDNNVSVHFMISIMNKLLTDSHRMCFTIRYVRWVNTDT